jgi:hypothetical protein
LIITVHYSIEREGFVVANTAYYAKLDNVETYERCSPLKLLLEDSRFMLPTVAAYSVLPLTIKALFILMTMAYQIHKLPRDTEKQVFVRARSATAYWSYQVVHALNEDISEEKTRASNQTMTSVILLIFADVSIVNLLFRIIPLDLFPCGIEGREGQSGRIDFTRVTKKADPTGHDCSSNCGPRAAGGFITAD